MKEIKSYKKMKIFSHRHGRVDTILHFSTLYPLFINAKTS